ncbi:MAG: hypothetical protein ACE5I7_18925 [Candidatus Binatia bacterium]
MRFVPMPFCTPNPPAGKQYGGNALHLAPAPLALQPLKTPEIADLAASGDAVDLHNLADDLEPHDPKDATVMRDTLTSCA